MRDRPAGVTEHELGRALARGWRLRVAALRYRPVGGGSYHWSVRDDRGRRWFVTVDDLADKGWLGKARTGVLAGLRAAMDTAVALRRHAALKFVVAPVPAFDGATVRPLGARYAVAVYPFLRGAAGRFGAPMSAPERDELVDMLAALHGVAPAAVPARRHETGLARRADLEEALSDLGRPWRGGPFAEPARALLAGAAGPLRDRLETLDRQSADLASAGETVVTHGEPHPGNLIRGGPRTMLIDWDTVGLARPERDLWLAASVNGDELGRYTAITGRRVDRSALDLYRLRWALDDTSLFVRQLRARHDRTAGAGHAWRALRTTIANLLTGPMSH